MSLPPNGPQYTKGNGMPDGLGHLCNHAIQPCEQQFPHKTAVYITLSLSSTCTWPDLIMADLSSDAGTSPNADATNNGRTAPRLRAACNECHASKVLRRTFILTLHFLTSPRLSTRPTQSSRSHGPASILVHGLQAVEATPLT